MIARLVAWLLAALLAFAIGSIAATQFVLARLPAMGVEVTLSQRLAATGHDLLGMTTSYLPLVLVALLIAFVVAALLARWLPQARNWLFVLAGAAGIVGIHFGLRLAFDITPVAAARTLTGLAVQGLAGASGGWLFVRLLARNSAPTQSFAAERK